MEQNDNITGITAAMKILREGLGENKVVPAGPAYERSRFIWNAAVKLYPKVIVLCENTDDVRSAVLAAAKSGASLSVRGGGHDWCGRSLRGEMMLDLTRMNDVTIANQVATVGGGALSTEVANAASSQGLIAVTGIIGSVGMAGLALGGGYGHLTAKCGVASDNILDAEVVLADGRVVEADESHEPNLFWAIRGGGGNFGVVTKLHLRLHPMPNLSDGVIAFSWDQAVDVMNAYDRMVDSIPDELTVMPTFFASPSGKLSFLLHHAFCGDAGEDERMTQQVQQLGKSGQVQVRRKTLAQVFAEAEQRTMMGISWIVRTVTLPGWSAESVGILLKAMENRSSPLSWIAAHPFYGRGERVPLKSTAFGIRQRHFMVGIYTAWSSGNEAAHRAWADEVEAALKPYALPSSYPNYFGTDRPEQAEQAFGANTERLLKIKRAYDPQGMFEAISMPRANRETLTLRQATAASGPPRR